MGALRTGQVLVIVIAQMVGVHAAEMSIPPPSHSYVRATPPIKNLITTEDSAIKIAFAFCQISDLPEYGWIDLKTWRTNSRASRIGGGEWKVVFRPPAPPRHHLVSVTSYVGADDGRLLGTEIVETK